MASLTKLMTALLLVESGKDLNGEVTVPTDLTQEFKDIQNANANFRWRIHLYSSAGRRPCC